MYIPKNHGFIRHYAYGGSGIFDSIANFLMKLLSTNTAQAIASTAIDVGKSAAKEVGKVGKEVAIDAGKKLVQKALTPKSKSIINKYTQPQLTPKSKSIINKYTQPQNINTRIDGSGAITIQDFIRGKLNGSGLKSI